MKVLLVSIAFPPKRDPESLQVAKYCKFLQQLGEMDLEVITSANPTLHIDTDESLLPYTKDIKIVSSIKIFENRYLNYLIRKISPDLLKYPDSKFSFWRQAKKIFGTVGKPEILYSRSYPVSSTLFALQLKKRWNLPWVLHLSDPWAIGSSSSLSPATQLKGKVRTWNKAKEEECFQLADLICLTSQKTIDLYKKAYPQFAHKFRYTPNVYDDDLIIDKPYTRGKQLSFVYTGGFGEARKPDALLKAISRFWDKYSSEVGDQVQFSFTGEMTRANRQTFNNYLNVPVIKHLGILPYNEVVELQRNADILINIDSDIADPSQAVFLPSKLLDYMVAQRRIMAITNSYSTTFDVVQDKLGDCFGFDQVNELVNYFYHVWTQFKNRNDAYFIVKGLTGEFSARENAVRLTKMFRELL